MLGAFILDAPGTFVSEAEGRLVIGNRPGMLHYSIAVGVSALNLALLWLLADNAWWLGVGTVGVFGLLSFLVLSNSQRYIVTAGHVAMRGRAAGFTVNRNWQLGADAVVRIDTRIERDEDAANLWASHQAQILTSGGWIAIAESMQRGTALGFAERIARVTGVKIVDSSNGSST